MDNFATTKNDMLLLNKLFGNLDQNSLPATFKLGKTEYKGISEDFSPTVRKRLIDSNICETIITGRNAKGIELRAEIVEYRDFPVIEWQLFFENTGKRTSEILSDLNPIDFLFPGKKAVLQHGNGDTRKNDGFETFETNITKDATVLAPINGVSCEGAFPFMRLCLENYVVNIAIGWTGQWQTSFAKEAKGIRFIAGQQRFASKIYAGEKFCTPKITLMLTDGNDTNRAMNMWRRWYFAHILPKEFGKNIPPKACMHVFAYNGPEFTGATTESQIDGLKQYIERGLKPDIWWFDAGWYKCDKHWPTIGTWEADVERFPTNGLAPIGECCEENDVQLLLWFEPERVSPGTWLAEKHPEWCLKKKDGTGNMLLNLGDKDACDWAIKHIGGLIKKWHVAIYRQDFNLVNPMEIWLDNEEKGRIGALENKHIQGYYRYWDALVYENPGLWIDSCAAGGRRNDLETLRRAVPLHYTDVGYGNHPIKQCQHQLHFEWIPYFRAHNMSWDNEDGGYEPRLNHKKCDEFAYQNTITPAITVMTEAWGDEDEFEIGRKMLPVWRRAAEIELRADYFPFTKSTKSNKELYAVEFSDANAGDGFVHVISNTLCETDTITLKLHVCDKAKYVIENPVSGEIKTVTGAALASGFTVKLPKRSGVIWFYKKVVD